MPFQSEKQRRYLWANEPEIARDWTDTYGSGIAKVLGGRIGLRSGSPHSDQTSRSYGPPGSASRASAPTHQPTPDRQAVSSGPINIHDDTAPVLAQQRRTDILNEVRRQQGERDYPDAGGGILNTKNIGRAQTGLDAYTFFNALKTGAFKYNPWTHLGSMALSKLGQRKRKDIGALQTNLGEDDEMTIEELFEGIRPEDLGLPKRGEVDWEDYMQGKVAEVPIPGQLFLPEQHPFGQGPLTQEQIDNMHGLENKFAGLGHYDVDEQMHLQAPGLDPFGNYGVEEEYWNTYPPLRPTGAQGGIANLWPR